MSVSSTATWVMQHKSRFSLLIIGALVLLIVANVISMNALIYVEVEGEYDASKLKTYGSTDADNIKIGNSGPILVSRKTKSILVTSGDHVKTQSPIIIPWYGYVHKKVRLQNDNNADKVAYRSTTATDCVSYNPSMDTLIYYNCRNPKNLLTYVAPADSQWKIKKIADINYSNDKIVPYVGGVVGIAYNESSDGRRVGDIVVTSASGKITSYNAPDDTDMSLFSRAEIFTDRSDFTNKRFALVDVSGAIYLGIPNQANVVEYRKIAAPDKYSIDYNHTYCSVSGESVICYRGRTGKGDLPEHFDYSTTAESKIISTSFTDEGTSEIAINNAPLSVSGIYISKGEIFIKRYKKLYSLKLNHGSYMMNEILQNVDAVAGGENLHVIQNGGVYRRDTDTSDFYQVFYSDYLKLKSVYEFEGKIFVIANTRNDKSVTYAYQLNSDTNTHTGRRLIDQLPSTTSHLSGVVSIDNVKDHLLVRLQVPMRGNSKQKLEQIMTGKETTINYLRSNGITIPDKNIQFIY